MKTLRLFTTAILSLAACSAYAYQDIALNVTERSVFFTIKGNFESCISQSTVPFMLHINDTPVLVSMQCQQDTMHITPYDNNENAFIVRELLQKGRIDVEFSPKGWVVKQNDLDLVAVQRYVDAIYQQFNDDSIRTFYRTT